MASVTLYISFIIACIGSVISNEHPCPTDNRGICISELKLWGNQNEPSALVEIYVRGDIQTRNYILRFETSNRDDLTVHFSLKDIREDRYVISTNNPFLERFKHQSFVVLLSTESKMDNVLDGVVCGTSPRGSRILSFRYGVPFVRIEDTELSLSRCGDDIEQTTPSWYKQNQCSSSLIPIDQDDDGDGDAENEDDVTINAVQRDSAPSRRRQPSIGSPTKSKQTAVHPTTKATATSPQIVTTRNKLTTTPTAKPKTTLTHQPKASKPTTTPTPKPKTTPTTKPTTTPTSKPNTTHTSKPTTTPTSTPTAQITTLRPKTTPRAKTTVRPKTTLSPQTTTTVVPITTLSPKTKTTVRPKTTLAPKTKTTVRPKTTLSPQTTTTVMPITTLSPKPKTTAMPITKSTATSTNKPTTNKVSVKPSSPKGSITTIASTPHKHSSVGTTKTTKLSVGPTQSTMQSTKSNNASSPTSKTSSRSQSPSNSVPFSGYTSSQTNSGSSEEGSSSSWETTSSYSSNSGETTQTVSIGSSKASPSSKGTTSSVAPPVLRIVINEINLFLEEENNTFVELQGPHHMTLVNFSLVVFDGQTKATLYHKRFVDDNSFTGSGFYLATGFKGLKHRKSVVVALFDNSKWFQKYQKHVPASQVKGLMDSFAVRVTSAKLDDDLLENFLPTHGNAVVTVDPRRFSKQPKMSLSRCQPTLQDPGAFSLAYPTPGESNNCTLVASHRVMFHLTDAQCKDFVENSKLENGLVDFIANGVNENCMCGFTQASIKGRKCTCDKEESLIFEAELEASIQWLADDILSSYRSFVRSSSNVVFDSQRFHVDTSCFEDCLPPPINPNTNNDNQTTMTIAVVVSCVGVFMIITIGVIIYIRRKKRSIVTFRLTNLGEMDTSNMLHEDTDDVVEDDNSTFRSISLVAPEHHHPPPEHQTPPQ